MRLAYLIFLSCFTSLASYSTGGLPLSCFNSVVGYQEYLIVDNSNLRSGFDLNLHFLILNGGYGYNSFYGSTMYVGLSPLISEFQVQYGYGLDKDKHSIRIRSDFPLADYPWKSSWTTWYRKYTDATSIGLFYEHKFYGIDRSIIGISLSISILGLF